MAITATPSRRRLLFTWIALALAAAGVFSLHYRDLTKPLPPFASLRKIPADGIRHELGKSRGGSQSGFEFFDRDGKRYQTPYLEDGIAMTVDDALRQGGVVLWVGPWQSALGSDSIFTVYHMTQGDRVLIDYDQRAAAKEKEQKAALPVMAISGALLAGIVVYVHRMHRRA